jgi:hypothetical protein
MVAALAIGAALAESYLRLFNPIDSLLYEMHPRYLFRLIPGARRLFVARAEDGHGRNLVIVNNAGFRGPELRLPRHGLRVVVYGDSFVMASLSPVEETFPARLARKLEAALHVPVEAVNAGVVGYGPDQECLRIEDEIDSLAPDLVVVSIFAGNDFGDLVRNKIFRLADDGGLRLNRYSLSRSQVENFPDTPGSAPSSMLWRGLQLLLERPGPSEPPAGPSPPATTEDAVATGREMSRQEYAYVVKIKGYLEKARTEYEDFVVRGNDEVSNLFGDTYNADVSLTPEAPSARYAKAVMEQVLVRIERMAASRGVPVLFVFIPSPSDCDGAHWSGWERAARSVNHGYRGEALTDVLTGIAERHGFFYVDLYQPILRAGSDSVFLPGDNHWNAAGEELAAELAKDRIIASASLRSRQRP